MWQVLESDRHLWQSVTRIKKRDKKLLQNVTSMSKHHNFKVGRNTSDNNLFQVSKFLEIVYRHFSNTYELTWTAKLSHI